LWCEGSFPSGCVRCRANQAAALTGLQRTPARGILLHLTPARASLVSAAAWPQSPVRDQQSLCHVNSIEGGALRSHSSRVSPTSRDDARSRRGAPAVYAAARRGGRGMRAAHPPPSHSTATPRARAGRRHRPGKTPSPQQDRELPSVGRRGLPPRAHTEGEALISPEPVCRLRGCRVLTPPLSAVARVDACWIRAALG